MQTVHRPLAGESCICVYKGGQGRDVGPLTTRTLVDVHIAFWKSQRTSVCRMYSTPVSPICIEWSGFVDKVFFWCTTSQQSTSHMYIVTGPMTNFNRPVCTKKRKKKRKPNKQKMIIRLDRCFFFHRKSKYTQSNGRTVWFHQQTFPIWMTVDRCKMERKLVG